MKKQNPIYFGLFWKFVSRCGSSAVPEHKTIDSWCRRQGNVPLICYYVHMSRLVYPTFILIRCWMETFVQYKWSLFFKFFLLGITNRNQKWPNFAKIKCQGKLLCTQPGQRPGIAIGVERTRLGWVHFIIFHIQILTKLLQGEMFRGYNVFWTYKVKWKPLFDGWVLGVLNIIYKVRKNGPIRHS